MTRIVLAALLMLSVSATSSSAVYCDKHQFGSDAWWTCLASQSAGDGS